jgi:hypothetical protein
MPFSSSVMGDFLLCILFALMLFVIGSKKITFIDCFPVISAVLLLIITRAIIWFSGDHERDINTLFYLSFATITVFILTLVNLNVLRINFIDYGKRAWVYDKFILPDKTLSYSLLLLVLLFCIWELLSLLKVMRIL